MKITKSQLIKIIQEEIEEVRYVDRASPEFQKWLRQQKPSALEKELEERPSLEKRVDRMEAKLDALIGMVKLNPAGASQKLRGPEGTRVEPRGFELEEEKDEH